MIKIISPGVYTTIQDLGRYGHRSSGVPLSGAMDQYAMRFANHLLDNDPNDAVIEMIMMGPKIVFESTTQIVITGSAFEGFLNTQKIESYIKVEVKPGDELSFQPTENGNYGYIAFEGGLQSEVVLGSRSFYRGITKHGKLKKGDKVQLKNTTFSKPQNAAINYSADKEGVLVEAYKGPEWSILSSEIQQKVIDGKYSVNSSSNRMAVLLEHALEIKAKEIITSPVQPGTVQLTPSGKMIALMRDAQTTGGYARILQLTEKAQCQLSQTRPNKKLKIKIID